MPDNLICGSYNNDSRALRFGDVALDAYYNYLFITGNRFAYIIFFAIFAEWMTTSQGFPFMSNGQF